MQDLFRMPFKHYVRKMFIHKTHENNIIYRSTSEVQNKEIIKIIFPFHCNDSIQYICEI